MSRSTIVQIESWFCKSDPDIRIFALVQACHWIGDLPAAPVEALISRALGDPDPRVVERGRILKAAGEEVRVRQIRGAARGTCLGGLPDRAVPVARGRKTSAGDIVREASVHWLAPCLDALHEALGTGRLPRPLLVRAIGGLGHRGSVGPLSRIVSEKSCAVELVEALDRIGGDDAELVLQRLADDESFVARSEALGRLGSSTRDEIVEILGRASRNGDVPDRLQVARALGVCRIPRALSLLSRLIQDVTAVAVEAILSMAKQKCPEFADQLLQLGQGHPDSKVRATVVSALAAFPEGGVEGFLHQSTRDANSRVRANAIETLARFQQDHHEARKYYFELVKDRHHRVQANAIVALFPLNPQVAEDALGKMVRAPDYRARAAACWAAGRLQSKRSVSLLADVLSREEDSRVLSSALRAFEGIDRPELLETIVNLSSFPRPDVRVLAVRNMAKIGGLTVVGRLVSILDRDSDSDVRREVIDALAALPRSEGLSYLPGLLKEPYEKIVVSAVRALTRSGTIEAAAQIRPLRSHASPAVRTAVMRALIGLGDLGTADLLAPALTDKNLAPWTLQSIPEVGELLTAAGLDAHPLMADALVRLYDQIALSGEFRVPSRVDLVLPAARGPAGKGGSIEEILGPLHSEPESGPAPAAPEQPVEHGPGYVITDIDLDALLGGAPSAPIRPVAPIAPPPPPARSASSPPILPPSTEATPAAEEEPDEISWVECDPAEPVTAADPPAPAEATEEDVTILEPEIAPVEARVGAPVEPEPIPAASPPGPDPLVALEELIETFHVDPARAAAGLAGYTKAHPDDVLGRFLHLRARLTSGDRSIKVEELEEMARPGRCDSVAVPFQMARIFNQLRRPVEVVSCYLDLLRVQLEALERLRDEGVSRTMSGDVEGGRRILDHLAEIVGMRPRFHSEIGLFCAREQLWPLAFDHLYRAHLAYPEDRPLTVWLATAAVEVDREDLARRLVEIVSPTDLPDEDRARHESLRARLESGRPPSPRSAK